METEEPLKYVEVIINGTSYLKRTPGGYHFKEIIELKPDTAGYIYIRVIQQDNGTAYSSPFFLV